MPWKMRRLPETNSSSSHSIFIDRSKVDDRHATWVPEIDSDGYAVIRCGEYGWERHRYHKAEDKLSYLVTYIANGPMVAYLDPVDEKTITEHTDGNNGETVRVRELRMLNAVAASWWNSDPDHVPINGIKIYRPEISEPLREWGYIDHQSDDLPEREGLFKSTEALDAFIFNPKSSLRTGNDNDWDDRDSER